MKKLLLIFILVSPVTSYAWEKPRNPDRFVSFGFNVSQSDVDGQRAEVNQPSAILTNAYLGSDEVSLHSIGADVRFPATNSLTLSLSYDKLSTEQTFLRQGGVYKESTNMDGQRVTFGLRLYLNK
jgi:hypothetical protein